MAHITALIVHVPICTNQSHLAIFGCRALSNRKRLSSFCTSFLESLGTCGIASKKQTNCNISRHLATTPTKHDKASALLLSLAFKRQALRTVWQCCLAAKLSWHHDKPTSEHQSEESLVNVDESGFNGLEGIRKPRTRHSLSARQHRCPSHRTELRIPPQGLHTTSGVQFCQVHFDLHQNIFSAFGLKPQVSRKTFCTSASGNV